MNIEDNNGYEPLRRSQRLRNKKNSNNGSSLTGDKRYIFTHNFNEDNKNKRKHPTEQNNKSNTRNHNDSKNQIYPTISRCKRRLKVVHTSPNVFIIENFLTENEINHLLKIAKMNESKFETSYTQASGTDQVQHIILYYTMYITDKYPYKIYPSLLSTVSTKFYKYLFQFLYITFSVHLDLFKREDVNIYIPTEIYG